MGCCWKGNYATYVKIAMADGLIAGFVVGTIMGIITVYKKEGSEGGDSDSSGGKEKKEKKSEGKKSKKGEEGEGEEGGDLESKVKEVLDWSTHIAGLFVLVFAFYAIICGYGTVVI